MCHQSICPPYYLSNLLFDVVSLLNMGRKPGKSRHLSSPRRKNRGENLRLWRERERSVYLKLLSYFFTFISSNR